MKRLLIFLAILTACATARMPGYDGVQGQTREIARCLRAGPCTVLQVDNANFYDAVIYVNGSKVGEASGLHHSTLFVQDARLDGGRCAVVRVRLVGPASSVSTTRECVREGWYYDLAIGNPFTTTVLVPRPAGR